MSQLLQEQPKKPIVIPATTPTVPTEVRPTLAPTSPVQSSTSLPASLQEQGYIRARANIVAAMKEKCGIDLKAIDEQIEEIRRDLILMQTSRDVGFVLEKLSSELFIKKVRKLVKSIKAIKPEEAQCLINNVLQRDKPQFCKALSQIKPKFEKQQLIQITKIHDSYTSILKQLYEKIFDVMNDLSKSCENDAQKTQNINEVAQKLVEPTQQPTKVEKFDENLSEEYNEGAEETKCVANSFDSCYMYGYTTVSSTSCICCCCCIVMLLILILIAKSSSA